MNEYPECPKCHGTAVPRSMPGWHRMVCCDCGLSGPNGDSDEEALALWKRSRFVAEPEAPLSFDDLFDIKDLEEEVRLLKLLDETPHARCVRLKAMSEENVRRLASDLEAYRDLRVE